MNVKLISITQPLVKTKEEDRSLTPEELIVFSARVSNPSNQLNLETSPKLLNYCIKNKHWSIFEQVDFTVEIETSRAIAAQILRHKSASFQEFSQRYAEVTKFEPFEFRMQGKTNRQVGDEVVEIPELNIEIQNHIIKSSVLYHQMVGSGIAKECARFILPLSTQTTIYMKNNIRNWIHYLDLRCSEHTQKEHRLIANEIKKIFIEHFPNISISLGWSNVNENLPNNKNI